MNAVLAAQSGFVACRQAQAEAAAADALELLEDTRQELAHCEQELVLYRNLGEKQNEQKSVLEDHAQPAYGSVPEPGNLNPHVQPADGVVSEAGTKKSRYVEVRRAMVLDASTNTHSRYWDDSAASQAVLADVRYQMVRHELVAAIEALELHEREAAKLANSAHLAGKWLQCRMLARWRNRSMRQKNVKSALPAAPN